MTRVVWFHTAIDESSGVRYPSSEGFRHRQMCFCIQGMPKDGTENLEGLDIGLAPYNVQTQETSSVG